ncbi:MAG: Coq4 family protein [Pseudomonadota bacterium]
MNATSALQTESDTELGEVQKPTVDREFAEKFLQAVDHPMNYPVYFLFHDWWEKAPQSAIDAYAEELASLPQARDFIDAGFISEPLCLDTLGRCAPGTLGHGYHQFIVANGLEANLGKNYRDFNTQLHNSGKLERLPSDMSYMMVRGFQIHDFLHVLTGYDSTPLGELALAAFYLAQLRFPYHAMRLAITLGHQAYIRPDLTIDVMDAITDGWAMGRSAENLNFVRWEDEVDTPLAELRERMGLATDRLAA